MTKTKLGEDERVGLPGFVAMRPSGSYEVRIPADRDDLMKEIEQGRGSYVMIGSILPVRSGAELCRLLESEDGGLQYPVYLLQSREPGEAELPLEQAAAGALAAGPLHPSLQQQTEPANEWGEVIRIRGLEIHVKQRDVLLKGKQIALTTSEFDLLCLMARRVGWALPREEIIQALRGTGATCTHRNVDVLIVGLRRKLGAIGECIQTVRGIGYRLRA